MSSLNLFHVIKDPVHGTMQFTAKEHAWIKPFIDSPHFQRLRHIKQLGMCDFIFPGAVHTRFNHCLGCSYVANQIAHKIGLNDEERQLVMIASLMHDIGHGPFSHAFEGLFHDKLIRHEDWTPYFLADYGTEQFFHHYNHSNAKHHLTQEKFKTIADMIMHKLKKPNVLADIVSSQLDADRLDYLLRDSHFCGVRYGEFDFRWMLHCMAIVNAKGSKRLGITRKGVGVVEHYLMARRLMMRNIYHLQKKLALEFFLVQLLNLLSKTLDSNRQYESIKATRLGKFLIAANHFNETLTLNLLGQHKKDFLENNYINYKELCDYDVFALIKQLSQLNDSQPASEIANRLQHRMMPTIVQINAEHLNGVQAKLAEFKQKHQNHFQDWQISLIQTPHQSYSGEDDPIFVVDDDENIISLSDSSLMINAISDKLEHVVFLSIDKSIAQDKRMTQFVKSLQIPPVMVQASEF